MILAAGKGSRLGTLTAHRPKALIPIHSRPALEWITRRLQRLSIHNILVNTHTFAEQVHDFVHTYNHSHPQPQLSVSHEEILLNTGGGILKSKDYWGEDSFIVHNVDVFSTADIMKAYEQHLAQGSLVTLLTQTRKTQTRLLIDENSCVCGINYQKKGEYRLLQTPQGAIKEQGFCGMHIIHPRLFSLISESGAFSIIESYLRLIQEGQQIHVFDIENSYWKDIGTPEGLSTLKEDWRRIPLLQELHQA